MQLDNIHKALSSAIDSHCSPPPKQQSGTNKVELTKTLQKTSSQKDVSAQHKGNAIQNDKKTATTDSTNSVPKNDLKATSGIQNTANNAKTEEMSPEKTNKKKEISKLRSEKTEIQFKLADIKPKITANSNKLDRIINKSSESKSIMEDLKKADNKAIFSKSDTGFENTTFRGHMCDNKYAAGMFGGLIYSNGATHLTEDGKAFQKLMLERVELLKKQEKLNSDLKLYPDSRFKTLESEFNAMT